MAESSSTEDRVAAHYTDGRLLERVLAALHDDGVDIAHLSPADLQNFDEFHVGGIAATHRLAGQLPITVGQRLLDVGCGLGGPARYFADRFGVRVDGVDLTAEFVDVGNEFTRLVGLSDQVELTRANALELPFPAATFDGASLLHVGMNIADKHALFAEVARVVRPGGLFAIYEIMQLSVGAAPTYPVPWATDADVSFLARPAQYQQALEAAGFAVMTQTDRRAEAEEFFAGQRRDPGSQLRGQSLVVGAQWPVRVGNLAKAVAEGFLAPTEMIARRR